MLDSFIAWVYGVFRRRRCESCNQRAVWMRRTQFAGDHYFCDKHARHQDDFTKEDPSYYVWEHIRKE